MNNDEVIQIETSVPNGTDDSDNSSKHCWVCFASEEDDDQAEWVQPCNCRGSSKWVHQACLQRWVDEKQKTGPMGKVYCPQCQTEYIIVFPNMGFLVYILDSIDTAILKTCPFLAAGLAVGTVYWSAVTYGAITVMQVLGHTEGLSIMEQSDPLVLLIGLPAVPVALILGKLVKWEDSVLHFIRRYLSKLPLIRYVLPFEVNVEEPGPNTSELPPLRDPVSTTRVICGALVLPTAAAIIGKLLFDSVPSNLHRTLLGGLTFIAIKGAFRIYHKQQRYVRQCHRKILNYTESNVALYVQTHGPIEPLVNDDE